MDNNEELKRYLEMMMAARSSGPKPRGFEYVGMEDFVLQHGVWFPEPKWFPMIYGGKRENKKCFVNSLMVAVEHGLGYVEGFASNPISDRGSFSTLHAWNVDANGRVVDSTWANSGVAYCGVQFTLSRAMRPIMAGDSVLQDWHAGFPIFRTRWTGEGR